MFSLDQYQAAHASAAIVDRSARGKITLSGIDRLSFLHALLTNDIARLKSGTGIYSAYLTPQGRMISDMRVLEIGDHVLLDVEGSLAGPLAERFDKLIFSEDVQVRNLTGDLGLFGVHGPTAAQVVERATGVRVSMLANQYDNVTEAGLTIVRDEAFGMPGFDMYVERGRVAWLRDSLLASGGVLATDATAEVLRVEAGRPLFGVDMDTETIPLEAGIEDRAISLTKGCYVGQEVIVRVLHRGHGRVARRLVGLLLDGERLPEQGDPIFAGDKAIGVVTSAVASPQMGAPIALGYVQRDYTSAGSDVIVKSEGVALPARVHALPFSR
jgi:folate-binding protein YgfZ